MSRTSTTRSTRRRRRPGSRAPDLAREMTDAYIADTDALGLGRPDAEPLRERDDRGDHRADRAVDRAWSCVRGRRRRLLLGALLPATTVSCPTGDVDDMDQGEGVEGAELKRDPLDFALWKAPEARRGHRLGRALGARPAGLAHRVLGDGRGAARRRLRDPRRRLGPDLPPPRERGGADRGGARRAAGAALDAQRDGRSSTSEKMAKSVGNIFMLREALGPTAATR